MGCIGSAEVALIDAAGDRAEPSGELRDVGGSTAQTFDCAVTSRVATDNAECANGVLFLGYLSTGDERFEVRFKLDDGSWSLWQEVPLDVSTYTDPDFNGPGCACTWYDGTTSPIVVPESAL